MVNNFPHFTQLNIKHKDRVYHYTKKFEPYSDFNFISLFCWNPDDDVAISELNGNLVIKLPDYVDGSTSYSILGENNIDESLNELLKVTHKLKLVPEPIIEKIQDKTKYNIYEDRDGFDYVYKLHDLSEMAGSHYKKKRNKNNAFVKDHENFELEVKVTHGISREHAELLREINSRWADETTQNKGDIANEKAALNKLLDNSEHFDLLVVEVFVDKEPKGFSINEIIDEDYAICHFEKALRTYHASIYAFLASQVAKKLIDHGCKRVNWEQDVGVEGLRISKLSYHPEKMLKKYTISLADK